ncbi:Ig-like domain-containing protein [Verrucomicrobia bacterium]|nr:Ig-like domain-containing protein [Verrucomicrobiota bacterium]
MLTDPPNIGKSFDDFWVRFGSGWGTWRFKGDPIANFACRATSEYDPAANDVPTLGDAGGTLSFTENGGATAIDGSLSVADVNDTNLESATITISSGYVSSEDVLEFTAQNGISGSWNSGSGVMSLSGTSSKANYEMALESLTYNNTSEDPNTSARTITWVINDGYENSSAVTSTVSVTVVNDAPTIAINTGVSVARAGSVIITASLLKEGDPDDSGAGLTYALTSAPVNGQLELTTGAGVAIGNFSQNDIDNSRVIYVHDGGESLEDGFAFSLADGGEDEASAATGTFSIRVTTLNDAPTVVTNTGGRVKESESVVITRAMLQAMDPDDLPAGLTYTVSSASVHGQLELTTGAGVPITVFTQEDIDSDRVIYKHDGGESLEDGFAFSLADGGEDAVSAATGTFSISVTALNDAPTVVTNTGGTVKESESLAITGAMLQASDPDDAPAGLTYTVSSASVHGQLELTTGAGVIITNFTQEDVDNSRVIYVHDGSETLEDGFAFSLADDGEDEAAPIEGVFNINVTEINDAPTVRGSGGALIFTENDGATVIDGNLIVTDADDTDLQSATIHISSGYNHSEDVLGFNNQNGIVGIWDAESGIMTLNGKASMANYQTALESLTYNNTSDAPNTDLRTIAWLINDGTDNSLRILSTVNVIAINDVPALLGTGDSLAFTENDGAKMIDRTLSVVDVDDTHLESATITISTGYVSREDVLEFQAQNGITGNWEPESGIMSLTGSASKANYETALESVTYNNTSDTPNTSSRIITWVLNDGNDSSAKVTSTVSVTAVNDSPLAQDDTYSVDEDGKLVVPGGSGVLINDSTGGDGGALVVSAHTSPFSGTLALSEDGSLIYTPHPDFNGFDTFKYTIADIDGTTSTGVVTITVNSVNDSPLAQDDSYTVDEDEMLSVGIDSGLLSNDSIGGDGGILAAVRVIEPSNGTLELNVDGSFTYVPLADYNGNDSFSYSIADIDGTTSTGVVRITVNSVGDNPLAADDSYIVDEDNTLTVEVDSGLLSNDSIGGDGGVLTVKQMTVPDKGTLTLDSDGSFSYVPSADYNGNDRFTYSIADSDGDTDTATVAIIVNSVDDSPLAQDDSYSVDEDGRLIVEGSIGLLVNDNIGGDGGVLVVSSNTSPLNGTLKINEEGSLMYIPSPDFNGSDAFMYTITDIDGTTSTGSVSIDVKSVNDHPLAQDDSYSVDEDNTLRVELDRGLLSNDSIGGDGGTLAATLVTEPENGTLTLNSDGSFAYAPIADYNGNDSFTYSIADSDGDADIVTALIVVVAEPVIPPSFSIQPSDSFLPQGSGLTLDFGVAGSEPMQYQWFLNGERLLGADQPTLPILPNIMRENSGSYVFRAENSSDTVISEAVIVSLDWQVQGGADDFAEAIAIESNSGFIRTSNSQATTENGEPRHSNKRTGNTIWYRWQPAASGLATLSLQGSSFDTVMAVYEGNSLTQLTEIESDDDRGGFSTSRLQFSAELGQDYMIAIGGFNGATGNILFSWEIDITQVVSFPRITIIPEYNTVSIGEPYQLTTSISGNIEDVQLQWIHNNIPIPGATGTTLDIATAQAGDAGVYWISVTVGDTTDRTKYAHMTVNVPRRGKIIRELVLEQKFADLFFNVLDLNPQPQFQPQLFGSIFQSRAASLATGFTGAQIFNTFGAVKEAGEPDHCGIAGGASQWFAYQSPTDGELTISTDGSDFDTVMGVYTSTGSSFGDLIEITCDNDSGADGLDSSVTFNASKDTIYYVAVDGVEAATGIVNLAYELEVGLTVQSVTIADLGMQFEIQTVPDITFVIEGTEDFENWVELISTSSVDGNFNYIDNEALISERRFYRVYVTD